MRTFIAVELPDEVRKNITELINELKTTEAAVKWVEQQNLHITLKFLGWVEDRKINEVMDLIKKAVEKTGSFKAKFAGLGTFPAGKTPRVVWVGVKDGSDRLTNLANALEKTLSQAGYRSQEREFSSHVTIGRIKEKKGVDKLIAKISEFKSSEFGEAIVNHVDLMKSTLTPKGPIYEKIGEILL
ncbi:MAG: RNA 2',3'-cyclic phosphodiesterase [Candidatus Margulisiibacteriota bacterium]